MVLEELNMAEDEPDELVHDLVSEALWPDHPWAGTFWVKRLF